MADRLRALLDLVVGSLDEPGGDGRALAARANFSRDHLDRLLAAATGESPVALRRRLLLERAGWRLRSGLSEAGEVAQEAGYGSLAAFSRAFRRAYGVPPSAFAASGRRVALPAPNQIRFHPPGGLLIPGPAGAAAGDPLTARLVHHHLDRERTLLELAAAVAPEALARPLRPGLVLVWFEGEEPTAALMAERLVATLEIWMAGVDGEEQPAPGGTALERLEPAGRRFARFVREVRDARAWEDAFVDALCEPPRSFTYGGVIAHVLTYGIVRREALAGVLAALGAPVPPADPILWEDGLESG